MAAGIVEIGDRDRVKHLDRTRVDGLLKGIHQMIEDGVDRMKTSAGDMPIIAAVGVSVGWLASALGRTADAASILGAAARLRGSEDHTEPHIAELTRDLRASLGPQFDELFDCARALDRRRDSAAAHRPE